MTHVLDRIAISFLLMMLTAALGGRAALAQDQATAPEQAPIELSYELPRDAQVSIVITNEQGQIVRELLHAAEREAGQHTEAWDGLDHQGEPVTAGDYQWKLLSTQGLHAEYLLTLGTNANPRWASWPGNHHGAVSIATDAQGRMYVGGGNGEGTALVVAQTIDDEERLWTIPHWLDAWQGARQLARAGDNLYILQSNAKLYVYDAATGERKDVWDIEKGYTGYELSWKDGEQNLMNMTGDADQLVAAYLKENAIRWLDMDTGEVLDELEIAKPWDVDLTADGRIIAISGQRIVRFTKEDKTPEVLVDGLADAHELAVDRETGEILVWVHGGRKQVLRYSSEGELLNTYGKEGGRERNGPYEPESFAHLTDLAVAGDGRFMIVEEYSAPRRVSLFDREGNVLREWYGGQQYSNHGAAEPDNPNIVWLDSSWGDLIRAEVDYENKSWKVLETYRFSGLANGLIRGTKHGRGRWRPIRHDGQLYLARDTMNLQLVRVNEEEHVLEPMAAGRMKIHHYWDQQPQIVKDVAGDLDKSMDSYVWSDLDADGEADPEEFVFSEWSKWGPGGWNLGPDLNLYFTDASGREDGSLVLRKLPIERWTDQGVPVYASWADNQVLGPMPPEIPGAGGRGRFTYPAEDGSVYATFNYKDGPGFGHGHFGGSRSDNRLAKWNPDGSLAWSVGRHAASSQPEPGEMHFFWRLYGTARGAIAAGDAHRTTGVWTEDGLWVGRLLENPVQSEQEVPASVFRLMSENFHGSIYERPDNGEVLYFAGVINNTHVFRITGWDQFEHQQGSLTITAKQAAGIERHQQEQAQRDDLLQLPPFGGPVDATLEKWKEAGIEPLQIKDGDKLVAEVYAGWSKSGIQALFDVKTDRPWASAATKQLAFQGGAGVDIKIAPMEDENGERPYPGYRVVTIPREQESTDVVDLVDAIDESPSGLASVDEPEPTRELETTSVEFYPELPPGERGRDRHKATYKTGQGNITFDRVRQSGRHQSAARLKPDDTGYIVEMRADFHDSVAPRPGRRLRTDFSVFLANIDGNATDLRLPWHSDDPADTITADAYFESLLRPDNWIETVLVD